MPEPETPHGSERPVLVEVGFDILVDTLTYHTSELYRHQCARGLERLKKHEIEDLLLTQEWLKHPAPVGDVLLSSLKFWYQHQPDPSPTPNDYGFYQEDLKTYLAATDYSDEPEHDLTKQRLLEKPILTKLEFDKLANRIGSNHSTSRRLGQVVVHRLLRRG